MKWGIVGFGSISSRHAKNINTIGGSVVVLTKNNNCPYEKVSSVKELLDSDIESILIANETHLHLDVYRELRKLNSLIPVLIEKPLFDKFINLSEDVNTKVAYCLRFHPMIEILKKLILNKEIISAQFYVGQYLPSWRPDRDYRTIYSAKKELGGGVLRDLSHEIDLAQYLLGDLELQFSKSCKLSNLEITSDDLFLGVFKSASCSNISIEMNYFDQIVQRYLVLHLNNESIKVDLISGVLTINQSSEKINFDKNEMYIKMLKSFELKEEDKLASFSDGMNILKLINKIESE